MLADHGRASVPVDGTNDLLMSDVLRRDELQVWFRAEHPVDTHATRP
jgi:starvation-inducible DNA-binding protein